MIEPELSAVTEEILTTIAREVPDYARPFEGSFGRGVRTGVTEALRQFVALIRDPDSGREPGRDVYVNLGRGELRQGRALDALQSAYRVGARVAWRRLAGAARRAELDAEVLSTLAESIFAYIEELSADSVEGYAEARSEREGERQRRRRELIALLLRDDAPGRRGRARDGGSGAGWQLAPQRGGAGLPARLPRPAVPAPAARRDQLGAARARLRTGAGPGRAGAPRPDRPGKRPASAPPWVPRALSASCPSRGPSRTARSGRPRTEPPARPAWSGPRTASAICSCTRTVHWSSASAGAGWPHFDDLTAKSRTRMEDTALAYLRRQGNAAAMAESMDVHAQTARYRLARLRGLLGGQLDDPEARFELELCLRERARRRGASLREHG